MMRRVFSVLAALGFLSTGLVVFGAGEEKGTPPADPVAAARAEIAPFLMRLVQPLAGAPPSGKVWAVETQVRAGSHSGRVLAAWDSSRLGLRASIPRLGEFQIAVTPGGCWLFVPRHNVLFRSKSTTPVGRLPSGELGALARLKGVVAGGVLAAAMAPVPDEVRVRRGTDGGWVITDRKHGLNAFVSGDFRNLPVVIELRRAGDAATSKSGAGASGAAGIATVRFVRWGAADPAHLEALLRPPGAPGREEAVDDADLRAMIGWTADILSEMALYRLAPKLAPDHFPGIARRQGKVVGIFRGTPEEMGRAHGTLFRFAVRDNVHRVVHAIGLVKAIDSGEWLPGRLYQVWARQKRFIPERSIREMDALADAAGLPRRWVYAANVYPELFHCSGMALRGKATADGRLLHGRILDYLTEGGLQLNAAVMVFVPDKGHAWVNIGYAGCIGSVTAMNEKGLTMGEMGGGGENYLDGMPMMFLVRTVMERFDNVPDALAWIRKTPRTCEYFYVLSDANRDAVGLASWARAMARAKGRDSDLDVVKPGAPHPLLPHPVPDCVLMSAGKRYENLVTKVRKYYGRITPDIAWDIMGEGVSMKSNLHVALFRPETLDFWLADAGPRGEPAWKQPRAHFNLGDLLREKGTGTGGEAKAKAK